MCWPKDKKRYENLKSSFINFKLLIEDLHKSRFNGFLEVEFKDEVYYILIEQGHPERIYIKDNEGRFSFNEGLTTDEVYKKSLNEQATISVYDVEPGKIDLLVGYLNAIPIYTNLSSEFTDFERLTDKLSKDELNGYLEVKFLNPSLEPFYLLYERGSIKDIFQKERSIGNSTASTNGIKSKLEKNEAHFNVFQVPRVKAGEPVNLAGEKEVETQDIREGQTSKTPAEMGEIAPESEQDEVVSQKAEQSVRYDEVQEIEVLEGKVEEIDLKSDIQEKVAQKGIKTESEITTNEVKREREEKAEEQGNRIEDLVITPYLGFAEALIQWVEKSVNRHMGEGYFSKAFKKGMLNVSDKYPFLDPFLAEFTYVDGKIHFSDGDTKAVEFLKGIYAAIDMIFEELTAKKRGEITKTLRHSLRDLERRFHEEIEILRVRTLMPTLFQ